MPSRTIIKTLADNTSYLSEKVTNAVVEKTDADLKVIHVVQIDPNTGKAIGVSDFFPTFKVLAFTKTAAVQNTWYTAFEGSNVEFGGLGIGITVADETVEIRVTIDGVTILSTAGIALAFAGNKFTTALATMRITSGAPALAMGAANANLDLPTTTGKSFIKGRSVKIEARKTTAAGASALQVFGVYWQ